VNPPEGQCRLGGTDVDVVVVDSTPTAYQHQHGSEGSSLHTQPVWSCCENWPDQGRTPRVRAGLDPQLEGHFEPAYVLSELNLANSALSGTSLLPCCTSLVVILLDKVMKNSAEKTIRSAIFMIFEERSCCAQYITFWRNCVPSP